MYRKYLSAVLATVALLLASPPSGPASATTIDGMITPVGESGETFIAVPINLVDGQGVKSLRWYNNDGATALTEVMLVGDSEGTPNLSAVYFSQTEVFGSSDAWTQLDLPTSVAAAEGGLFAVLKIPAESRSAIGVGGGPGVGYQLVAQTSHVAQISADGHDWVPMDKSIDLAFQTVTAAAGLSKVISGTSEEDGKQQEPITYTTGLKSAYPNPANPSVRVRFEMAEAGDVRMTVYNVRGQAVRTLVNQWVPRGEHQAQWLGTDEDGTRVSSGVYYIRFEAQGVTERTRVTLVR